MNEREWLARGFRALSQGQLDQAAACCRQVLEQQPQRVPAHFLVGLVALAGDDRKTARAAFATVTRLQPDHAAAWAHLAKLLAEGGQVNRADLALSRAVEAEDGDIPEVHEVIGHAWSLLGEHAEADAWFRRAVDARPQQPGFRINYANNLIYLGRSAEARNELSRALQQAPGSAQAHWLLSGLDKARDREHLEAMRGLLRQPRLPPRAQAFLHYAIGKELEDLADWGAAFTAFAAGARARRADLHYDEANEQATFAALERVYTGQWLENRAAGDPSDAPIFIIGQPRTGTTLVERMITAHSRVHSAGELQQFGNSVRRLARYDGAERFSPALFEQAAALDPAQLGREYLQRTARLRGALPHFVDKLPYNYLFLPHILAALPRARVVHLVRDPRDVCFSVFKQLFADAYPHSYELGEMARHFVRYHRLMACWRQRFPGRFIDLHYEAVVADVEGEARRLLDYLGLPFEQACVDFHRQDSAVSTASAVQVREPAHRRSVGRWRRYREALEPALAVLREAGLIDQEARASVHPETDIP